MRSLRPPRSGPEWGTVMVGLMVLFGLFQLLIEDAPLIEAAGIGFYVGGIAAISLMVLYLFLRGAQAVLAGQ
jgi:hypothetical protein